MGRCERAVGRRRGNRMSIDGMRDNDVIPHFAREAQDHLTLNEKPLASFLAFLAALFSIKVFSGFFLFCFLVSLALVDSIDVRER